LENEVKEDEILVDDLDHNSTVTEAAPQMDDVSLV